MSQDEQSSKPSLPKDGDDDPVVLCEKCAQPIPKERIEALPGTKTCIKCSDVQPIHGDGRYGDLTIGRSDEEIRRMRLRYE